MIRPCFLVIDREQPVSISTRKLVIETAKLNVITVYSSQEAIETLQAFPAVHGAVLDGLLRDMPCEDLIPRLHAIVPGLPIVVVGGPNCGDEVKHIDHFDPQALLTALKALQPQKAKLIEQREAKLVEES